MQSENLTSGRASGPPDMPLFHAAWLFAAGIAATQWLSLRPSFILITLAPIATLSILSAARAQRIAWFPQASLWVLLGAWCACMEPHPAPAPALAALSDGLLRTIEGTVVDTGPVRAEIEQNVDEPSAIALEQRVDLQVSSAEVVTDEADEQAPVTGGVRLAVRWSS